jgi:hypothetical protein
LVSFGVGTLIVLGGFFLWRSDIGGSNGTDKNSYDGDQNSINRVIDFTADDAMTDSSVSAMAFLDRARSAYDAGEFETAVEMGYGATRNRFASVVPTAASTHWEFYNACREADLDDETVSTIGDVTQQYERAAFAANRVSRETATAVIEAASSLVGEDDTME